MLSTADSTQRSAAPPTAAPAAPRERGPAGRLSRALFHVEIRAGLLLDQQALHVHSISWHACRTLRLHREQQVQAAELGGMKDSLAGEVGRPAGFCGLLRCAASAMVSFSSPVALCRSSHSYRTTRGSCRSLPSLRC